MDQNVLSITQFSFFCRITGWKLYKTPQRHLGDTMCYDMGGELPRVLLDLNQSVCEHQTVDSCLENEGCSCFCLTLKPHFNFSKNRTLQEQGHEQQPILLQLGFLISAPKTFPIISLDKGFGQAKIPGMLQCALEHPRKGLEKTSLRACS